MPDLPASRSRHGCDVFASAGDQYLVVYGGIFASTFPARSWLSTVLGDIAVLKMGDLRKGWFQIPGAALDMAVKPVSGGLVKSLRESFCDMMYIESGNVLHVCSGNYSWTNTTLSSYKNTGISYVPVGAAILSPCTLE